MAAQFKSNVRLREEKGFGSVSMKRLIFCGVGAVLVFMVLRFTPLSGVALPLLVVVFILLLVLTGSRGGLPLWQRLLLGLRGVLVLAAARKPHGAAAQVAQMLNLDPTIVHLSQSLLFKSKYKAVTDTDWSEWVIFANLEEAEGARGLRFIKEIGHKEIGHGEPL